MSDGQADRFAEALQEDRAEQHASSSSVMRDRMVGPGRHERILDRCAPSRRPPTA